MATYQYNGTDQRDFPTLGVTVNPGDTFDAVDGLTVDGLTLATGSKKTTTVAVTSESTTDTSAGA